MSELLKGKVAIVTGSTMGIGAATAELFAREGARVVVTGLPPERGQEVAKRIGNGSIFVPGDLRDVAATRGIVEAALKTFGGVDILVNNAAITDRSTLEDFTPEFFDRQVHINLRAPLLLAQAALPSLKERKGVIVNVGSVNAYVGWQNLLIYAAAKAALVAASKNMANAYKYSRVRVFCINPGWINSEGERAMMKRLGHPDGFIEQEGKDLPIGRLIEPAEIAEAILFLASERSAAFSGAVIDLEQFPVGCLTRPKATEPFQ